MELDHIFICVSAGAPEIEALLGFGLKEGIPNRHPGQGTACRKIAFENAYLEFLWMEDATEITSGTTSPLFLFERCRWRETGASPFGLCFRPTAGGANQPSFPHWSYRPAYLPPDKDLPVGENSENPAEPLVFFNSTGKPPVQYPVERRPPTDHPNDIREITKILLSVTGTTPFSPVLNHAGAFPAVTFQSGVAPLLEVTFDHGKGKERHDLRPLLPVILNF